MAFGRGSEASIIFYFVVFQKVRYYQDVANGAFMTVECKKNPYGPCTRLLVGETYFQPLYPHDTSQDKLSEA